MNKPRLWYTKRGNEIRGPFPAKQISRYILLGRVVKTDLVSVDQHEWIQINKIDELIPDVLKLDLDVPENQDKLQLARMREDERHPDDRRDANEENEATDLFPRNKVDRRSPEAGDIVRHRIIKNQLLDSTKKEKQKNTTFLMYFLILLAVVGGVIISKVPKNGVQINNCDSPPKPRVNWNNCSLQGLQLQSLDLTNIRMQNANLTGAKLDNTKLDSSRLAYANFANATAKNASFKQSLMLGTIFRKADLSQADLSESNMKHAILHSANLKNANFSNSNLTHVVFNNADISGADFTGAILDKAIWVDNTVCAPESVGKCIPVDLSKNQ